MSSFPPATPAALQRQAAHVQSRLPNRSRPDDSSETASMSSWSHVPDSEGELPPVPDNVRLSSVAEEAPQAPPAPSAPAPATQAARNFVDRTNETKTARRLRIQQERAAAECDGVRWGEASMPSTFTCLITFDRSAPDSMRSLCSSWTTGT